MTAAQLPDRFVGMGDLAIVKEPGTLEIRGLGSCIALALHDPLQRLAGLAHIVVPRPLPNTPPAPAWSATDAVPALIAGIEAAGGRAGRLVARIAGGASMFLTEKQAYAVGQANADEVERLLRHYRIPVLSRQLGGHASRNVRLRAADGRLDVTTTPIMHPRRLERAGDDPQESARRLLEAAVAPLANVLQRPVAVEDAGRYELNDAGLVSFLGARTELRWSQMTYTYADQEHDLHLVLPEQHARRVDVELAERLPEAAEEGSAIDEVLNIMLSHALTALAKMGQVTLRPMVAVFRRGTTAELLASCWKPRPGDPPLTLAHGRLHVEQAFHGAELVLIGQKLP